LTIKASAGIAAALLLFLMMMGAAIFVILHKQRKKKRSASLDGLIRDGTPLASLGKNSA